MKPTVKTLKNKLDKVFSAFIRQRGMSDQGLNRCVSCGAVLPWQRLQCGHYHRRQHLGTRWDERNCHPQCMACNVWRRGNYANFAKFMYSAYSRDTMNELDILHAQVIKLTRVDLEAKIAHFQAQIRE